MKAYIYTKYGPPEVLEYKEIEKPLPQEDQVLVKTCATSLNAYDWHLMKADPFIVRLVGEGFLKPKHNIPGADIAGRVEAVGSRVTQFQPGDEVFGDIGGGSSGGFAEFACAREDKLAAKPVNMTFAEAAAVPMAALTALQALRDYGHIQSGQKVLINGASGGVGTFAVQIAKSFDAEVTAVCSPRNVEAVRSLGADHVIDYTQEDFTRSGQHYDLILGANGYHSIFDYRRALTPAGAYVMTGGSGAQMFQALLMGPLLSRTGANKMGNMMARQNQQDLIFIKGLIEAGKVKSVIDRLYPFSEAVEALRYLEAGHARGKIVISLEQQ